MPAFFVPRATSAEDAEQTYGALAQFAGRTALPMAERIFAITYNKDGTEWTAEVGAQLRGVKRMRRRRQGRMVDVAEQQGDQATVLAVFPGTPYLVVTDGRPLGAIVSGWVNPFMAGPPLTVRLFSATPPPPT